MSMSVKCPECGGIVGRDGGGRLACPLCDFPADGDVYGVCVRCDAVKPESLLTSWHGEGYCETLCLSPCARDASTGVADCAG
jgi:hypothetical protein